MITPFSDTFRLQNEEIRPGNSPQDGLLVVREAGAKVEVPFRKGSTVYVFPMTKVVVTEENGVDVADLTAIVGDKAVILGSSINLQF